MSTFLLTDRLKWIVPIEFDLNKYTSNSSKRCGLEVALEDLMINDYRLARNEKRNTALVSAKDCRFIQYSYC